MLEFCHGEKSCATANNSKETIVPNRRYAGRYLSTHLGHEVINMFQADNGKHYLYLNSQGSFDEKRSNAKNMLLVMHVGGKRVEILGLAKGLRPAPGTQRSLTSNTNSLGNSISEEQQNYILNEKGGGIRYGGVPMLKLFSAADELKVFVSYEVDENNFFVPKKRMVVCFDEKEAQEEDIILNEHNFASTSLRQFIQKGSKDYEKLISVIANEDMWQVCNEKVVRGTYTPHGISLFDICRIRHDENCFSDALAYYMEKYPKLWVDFFGELGISIKDNFTVSRVCKTAAYKPLSLSGMKFLSKGVYDSLTFHRHCKNKTSFAVVRMRF